MQPILDVKNLHKTYAGGFEALKDVSLEIERGEIFGLLGPNGAGKTTLINIVCGMVNATSGTVRVGGNDIVKDYRATRAMIGLVPQELPVETFESVWNTASFSRGLFGKPPNPAHIEKVLRSLSLWDKKDSPIMGLSGGMKRRVLIAKALAHEPELLFLDEPTAGVDVVILTTHCIEEAEQMADRVGVINHGEVILVRETESLMRELGKKQLFLMLNEPLPEIPAALSGYELELGGDGNELIYTYDSQRERTGITTLLGELEKEGIAFHDLNTSQSSLEEIFVDLVKRER